MAGEPYRWVATAETDMVELRDPVSGRAVEIVRPSDEDLPAPLLREVETLVFDWANLLTQYEAWSDLHTLYRREPDTVLWALSWLLALWAVVGETRTGKPADAIIRDLDYRGGWRDLRNAEDERVWTGLTQRVRLGGIAALTEDPRAVRAYHDACVEPADIGPILLRHTLIHLDALSQDMDRAGMRARGLASAVLDHTAPDPGPRRRLCFRPSRSGPDGLRDLG
ncbi:hypothetical protein [Nocardia nova]|uniref:hypothetical protein n=2 Tax=Nocardia nova TaxID=37330 RepID=UPI001895B4F1|nr:hypothetical protein [Nocardia nova]MBF6144283.1 hypothetical protein [Nocardia nova]MDN2497813.1 hypothetical protein [Nocardia nova]